MVDYENRNINFHFRKLVSIKLHVIQQTATGKSFIFVFQQKLYCFPYERRKN